jgi:hypothetical protein
LSNGASSNAGLAFRDDEDDERMLFFFSMNGVVVDWEDCFTCGSHDLHIVYTVIYKMMV